MGLDNLLATLEKRDSVTAVTAVILDDVTLKPAWIKACTSVTSQNDITANDEAAIIAPPEPSEIAKPETLQDRQREARRQKVDEETAIRAWLTHIEETDPAMIAEVLGQCRNDAQAREYFLRRAEEVPPASEEGE